MTLVLHNTLAPPTLTVSHEPGGGLTIYAQSGPVRISPEDAWALSEYIRKHNPTGPAAAAPEVRDVRDHATTPREAYDAASGEPVEL